MQSALHITTKVLPGNKIEIEVPAGSIGENIDRDLQAERDA